MMNFLDFSFCVSVAKSSQKGTLAMSPASPLSSLASLFWISSVHSTSRFPTGYHCKSYKAATVTQGQWHQSRDLSV